MTTTDPAGRRSGSARRALGWAVHLYTASGAVFAFLFLVRGVEGELREAFLWSVAAMVVDATDGALARRVDVRTHVPEFDGALLDNIVDYLTYVLAPLVLLHQNGYLPQGTAGVLVVAAPLLASCYQFCRSDAKEGGVFWGFPDYWNVVALYVVVLGLGRPVTVALLLVCSVLAFVPVAYLYPSRATDFRRSSLLGGAAWAASCLVLVLQLPDASRTLAWLSLLYVAYYVLASLVLTRRLHARRAAA